MNVIKKYFDLYMPEIIFPENPEKLGDFIRIKSTDNSECRQAIFTLARFFKREFNFDSILYAGLYDKEDDNECYSYIFTLEKNNPEIKSTVVGGLCFRLREWGGYGFQWIWLHPYIRNRGILSKNFTEMELKFGKDFFFEPPYSLDMNKFIKSKNINKAHLENYEVRRAPKLNECRRKINYT